MESQSNEIVISYGLTIKPLYYDLQFESWSTPDPAEQFHNPYLAMGNNPVMYVDPDGEFVMFAVAIGAISNMIIQDLSGNVNNGQDASGALLVGGMAGMAGAAAGLASGGGLGFGAGALQGAVGGFTGGTGNAWFNGVDAFEGLNVGLRTGGIGAVTGAGFGGVYGGFSAKKAGLDFWTGTATTEFQIQGASGEYEDIAKAYNNSSAANINDDYLKIRLHDEFNVSEGDFSIRSITTKTGSGYGMNPQGGYVSLKSGNQVGGYVRRFPTYSEMHISPNVTLAGEITFRAVAGHELIHAYHYFTIPNFQRIFSERAAYRYTYNTYMNAGQYFKATSFYRTALYNEAGMFWGAYPSEYQLPTPLGW